MTNDNIDLKGMICPYPVVSIIKNVDRMRSGEKLTFIVDDPLCLKSVPDELEDYNDITVTIKKIGNGWEITITRS